MTSKAYQLRNKRLWAEGKFKAPPKAKKKGIKHFKTEMRLKRIEELKKLLSE